MGSFYYQKFKWIIWKASNTEIQQLISETVEIQTDSVDEPQTTVVSEEAETDIFEIEKTVLEDVVIVHEVIDYTRLSIEERASLLPAPTDDYTTEYRFTIRKED